MQTEKQTDILIVGASVGGVAAALSALRMGYRVVLTEETRWIGGQLTSQGTPPDENPWIDTEQTGCTASYRAFREAPDQQQQHRRPSTAHQSAAALAHQHQQHYEQVASRGG